MIEVKRNGTSITIKGHAGSAEVGKDIVCASASMLFYTLVENIDRMQRDGKCKAVIKALEGDAEVKTAAAPGYIDEAVNIYNTICTGFEILAESYPEYVHYSVG